jgi:hypothetical protein
MSTPLVTTSYKRAATAIVQCRLGVEKAREGAHKAFVILSRMSEEDCGGQSPAPQLLVLLQDVLGRLEDTALALGEVRKGP